MRPRWIKSRPVEFLRGSSDWDAKLVAGQPPDCLRCPHFRQSRSLHCEHRRRAPKAFSYRNDNASGPFWSADGRWIYFNTERPNTIWKAPVDGGASVRLTSERRPFTQESVDGARVFFYKVDGGHLQAWCKVVSGGDERPVLECPQTYRGVPARNGITSSMRFPRHFSLNYFDFVTRRAHKIADLPSVRCRKTLHLRRRTYLSLRWTRALRGDIVLMEVPLNQIDSSALASLVARGWLLVLKISQGIAIVQPDLE